MLAVLKVSKRSPLFCTFKRVYSYLFLIGSLTASIGEAFKMRSEFVRGCDVRPMPEATGGFRFTLVRDNEYTLPYAVCMSFLLCSSNVLMFACVQTGSADLVTALMSLHHMREPQRMLAEVLRVLSARGGVFVIREHDCTAAGDRSAEVFARQLDVMHAFYAVVWPRVREVEGDFCQAHFARYLSRAEWLLMMQQAGFEAMQVRVGKLLMLECVFEHVICAYYVMC